MAMNKREQAELDAAKKAVVVARALNWSEPIAPDVPPPSHSQKDTLGFAYNAHSECVLFARSSSVHHATSYDAMPTKTNSQRALSIYSTRLLALKAMRHSVELVCAEKLARIDMQIAAERAK